MVKNIFKRLFKSQLDLWRENSDTDVIIRSICFVNCAVFANKFVDPSKWFLFPFKDRFSGDETHHVRGAIVADQFSEEVFKKLLIFKQLSHDKTNKMACAPSLIWVFAVCFMGS